MEKQDRVLFYLVFAGIIAFIGSAVLYLLVSWQWAGIAFLLGLALIFIALAYKVEEEQKGCCLIIIGALAGFAFAITLIIRVIYEIKIAIGG